MRRFPLIAICVSVLVAGLVCVLAIEKTRGLQLPRIAGELTKRLSPAAYAAEQAKLFAVLKERDPREVIAALKKDMGQNPSVRASCHELLHDVGRAAYRKYKNFGRAAEYQDEICVAGYIHGVLEAYFSEVKDKRQALLTVCANTPEKTFKRWECYHGIGHGLMFSTDNDLPQALAQCDTFAGQFENGACENGVFMENFNADQEIHISKYLDPARPLYPCTEEQKNFGDCYMNAPIYYLRLHEGDYFGALRICDAAPGDGARAACYYGAGGQATRRNADNPKLVEKICAAEDRWRTACISGMANWYMSHFIAEAPVLQTCAGLDAEDQPTCFRSVAAVAASYSDL